MEIIEKLRDLLFEQHRIGQGTRTRNISLFLIFLEFMSSGTFVPRQDVTQEVTVFVVSLLLFQCSSCDDVWSIACGITALNGMSRLVHYYSKDVDLMQ